MVTSSAKLHEQPPLTDTRRELLLLLRCQMVLYWVLWVAVFAPLTCQYHGLMIEFSGSEGHVHDHLLHTAASCNPSSEGCASNALHQTGSTATVFANLFMAAIPDYTNFRSEVLTATLIPMDTLLPSQTHLAPPDQPPRLA